jgi:hypothetical protein
LPQFVQSQRKAGDAATFPANSCHILAVIRSAGRQDHSIALAIIRALSGSFMGKCTMKKFSALIAVAGLAVATVACSPAAEETTDTAADTMAVEEAVEEAGEAGAEAAADAAAEGAEAVTEAADAAAEAPAAE